MNDGTWKHNSPFMKAEPTQYYVSGDLLKMEIDKDKSTLQMFANNNRVGSLFKHPTIGNLVTFPTLEIKDTMVLII